MARDIIEMDSWKSKCPCCSCDLEIEWQLAIHEYGDSTPQFNGLKCIKKSSYKPYALEINSKKE